MFLLLCDTSTASARSSLGLTLLDQIGVPSSRYDRLMHGTADAFL